MEEYSIDELVKKLNSMKCLTYLGAPGHHINIPLYINGYLYFYSWQVKNSNIFLELHHLSDSKLNWLNHDKTYTSFISIYEVLDLVTEEVNEELLFNLDFLI